MQPVHRDPGHPRLTLRALTLADAPRLAVLAGDAGVARQTAAIPHPYTTGDAERFVAAQAGEPAGRRAFAIDLAGEGLAGCIGLRAVEITPWPELGYWLGRPYWGAGLATEAARAVLSWAAGRGRRVLAAGHFADNPASGRVLEKAGFLYTGVRRPSASLARGGAAESREMVWLA